MKTEEDNEDFLEDAQSLSRHPFSSFSQRETENIATPLQLEQERQTEKVVALIVYIRRSFVVCILHVIYSDQEEFTSNLLPSEL